MVKVKVMVERKDGEVQNGKDMLLVTTSAIIWR